MRRLPHAVEFLAFERPQTIFSKSSFLMLAACSCEYDHHLHGERMSMLFTKQRQRGLI
jgi:hypothetical protein